MLQRIIRALKLDKTLYNEVEADPQYDQEAYMIVAIAAVLSGIGGGLVVNAEGGMGWSFTQALFSIIMAFVGYLATAYIVFFIGTRFFGGTATYGEMRRTLGFAYSANLISIIPCIGALIALIWSIATYFTATREGLDLDNTKAALTVVVSWVVWIVIAALIGGIFGLGAAGLGAISSQLGG